MEYLWDEFTEEDFRRMKKTIVDAANDDAMTVKHIGRVEVGDVHIELYICEEPDERFTVQHRYFVGLGGRDTDAALLNVRSDVEGFPYGEYKAKYEPFQYREDLLYEELTRIITEDFEDALSKDTDGILRGAVEHPTGFWTRAKEAVNAKVRNGATTLPPTVQDPLVEKIRSLADLPAEEFKAKVLTLTGVQ